MLPLIVAACQGGSSLALLHRWARAEITAQFLITSNAARQTPPPLPLGQRTTLKLVSHIRPSVSRCSHLLEILGLVQARGYGLSGACRRGRTRPLGPRVGCIRNINEVEGYETASVRGTQHSLSSAQKNDLFIYHMGSIRHEEAGMVKSGPCESDIWVHAAASLGECPDNFRVALHVWLRCLFANQHQFYCCS